ncbi:sigma factor G inhibitor Gin [Texcoconibacillus texcoconensis]|uniref:Uncharacterized protein (DUF983 family) n=1 Tax=Texcoconibacillus texcoconensis TaxID=1095777 RepID=A0A840QUA8_9BACI|nr:uncharacterized protein (DUF983 family) [Texcoconibacillus texcoconensis]
MNEKKAITNGQRTTCVVCETKREKGIYLLNHFICETCEEKLVNTDTDDENYPTYVERLRTIRNTLFTYH